MSIATIERCKSCRFYRASECRAAPPVRLPRKFDDKASAGSGIRNERLIWGWPAVRQNDWCGKWFPRSPR